MDLNLPIPTQSIQDIQQLAKGHPVFLVNFTDDCVVIKAENTQFNKQVRDPVEIMNVVDPSAKTRVIQKTELMGLRGWVQGNGDAVTEYNPGELLNQLVGALKPPMPGPGGARMQMQERVWIMMHVKPNLKDLKGVGEDRLAGDKSGVKEIGKALNQPGTLEKLGEIIAADAFNGNQDRVNFENSGGQPWQGKNLECIQNVGNFFFSKEGGKTVAIGLDSYDPTNQFKDLDTFANASDGFQYPGTILKQDAGGQRQALARKIVADIENILGPRNRKIVFARKERLPKDAAQRIERGMQSGAQKILNHLKQRFSKGGVSQGLQRRLNACGWLTRTNFPKLS